MADFDIHLIIINQTQYTFSGSYSAKTGHKVTVPNVNPGQTSGVITAKHKKIDLGITSQTTEGAEGTFHLSCNGNFEDPEDTKLDIYADVPYIGDNKFSLLKISPFLKLKLRFGNGIPKSDPNWGSQTLPLRGHPLGIQMTITQQPPVEQFSLLTYNTHLFAGSNAALVEPSIVAYDTERRLELVNRIRYLKPDIVCLQEVWAKDVQKQLAEQLRQFYPHVYIVPDEGSDTFILIDWLLDEITNSSGLMVASQYPIRNPRFEMYKDLSGDDSLAKKGALAFSVRFPVSATKCSTTNIGTTHCPTGIPDAQRAIKTAAKLTFGNDNNDGLLAGDFNLHKKTKSEYDELNTTLVQYRAHDIVQDFLPTIEESYTDWPGGNLLSKSLGNSQNPDNKDRIDYVYFAPGSRNQHLKPISAKVFHDWKLGNGVDVSDHYPVFVKFEVIKVLPTITWANPKPITYGTALGMTQLNAKASVPGTFSYTPAAGTKLQAGNQTLSTTFTPNDRVTYSSVTKEVQISVLKATPTITWPNPEAIVQGTPLGETQLNASATDKVDGQPVRGDYSYFLNDKPIKAGDRLPAGQHTLHVRFEPNGSGNFTSATGSVPFRIWLATHVFSKYEAGNEETFSHLALKHYGHATPYYWQWIIDHNKGIIPENYKLTRAGTKVYIPEAPPPPGNHG